MATLNITQYTGIKAFMDGGYAQAPKEPALARSSPTIGVAAEVTLDSKCHLLCLTGDAVVYLNFGDDVSVTAATATDTRLLADDTRFFRVDPGSKFSHYDGVT